MSQSVSVVIPSYNMAHCLPLALDSALGQTRPPDEIIVVDDGSTDDTGRVVKAYGSAVRYIRQDNAGCPAARNRGIAEARGDWIASLDADDDWLPHKLELQCSLLDRHPHLRWCSCAAMFQRDGRRVQRRIEALHTRPPEGAYNFFEAIGSGMCFSSPGMVVHRQVYEEVGPYDSTLNCGEDRDMWYRIAMHYPLVGYISRVCLRIRLDTAQSMTRGSRNRDTAMRALLVNLDRSQAAGPDVRGAFYPVARKIAHALMLRAASGTATIDPALMRQARVAFPCSMPRRAVLGMLEGLPQPLSRRLYRWCGDLGRFGPWAGLTGLPSPVTMPACCCAPAVSERLEHGRTG